MFSRWPSVCLSIRPSVVCMSVRPSALRFRSITYVFITDFKLCICICTNNVPLGIVNGQILIINRRVMALYNVQIKALKALEAWAS